MALEKEDDAVALILKEWSNLLMKSLDHSYPSGLDLRHRTEMTELNTHLSDLARFIPFPCPLSYPLQRRDYSFGRCGFYIPRKTASFIAVGIFLEAAAKSNVCWI
ncbi:hypothetical protein WA026_011200 [Henosepilachna vigintioctopunctata]|uniref:Uncharacterized protein n=1 Tax=Henosepilachna vigintioctopunctata TaxID=420089 RepID=A0AAW1U792_9CUCU